MNNTPRVLDFFASLHRTIFERSANFELFENHPCQIPAVRHIRGRRYSTGRFVPVRNTSGTDCRSGKWGPWKRPDAQTSRSAKTWNNDGRSGKAVETGPGPGAIERRASSICPNPSRRLLVAFRQSICCCPPALDVASRGARDGRGDCRGFMRTPRPRGGANIGLPPRTGGNQGRRA